MWEQVRANRRKSILLVFVMLLLLGAFGFSIGMLVEVYLLGGTVNGTKASFPLTQNTIDYSSGIIGIGIAFGVWFVMALVSYFQGHKILLAVNGAKRIEKSDHPRLFNIVEEMSIAASLPKMPQVYIVNDMSPNAFATGRDASHAAVAVTAGLLSKLNRDQLQGVIAHEISHIVNRDVTFMSMVGVMLGTIVMISETISRMFFYSGGSTGHSRRYSSSSKKKDVNLGPIVLVFLVIAILAPIFAQLIYFAISRKREYLADANAAVFTRYPEGLASALELIGRDPKPVVNANNATASMYIVNPFKKVAPSALSSTHPPIAERVKILRKMGGNISYATYQNAWRSVGEKAGALPGSALLHDKNTPARAPHVSSQDTQTPTQRVREAGDLLRNVNQFAFLTCTCGLRFKVPPTLKKDSFTCPRCKAKVVVPVAQMAVLDQVADSMSTAPSESGQPLNIKRKPCQWTSFKCQCGQLINLSPSFLASEVTCKHCKRKISITI